MLGPRLASLHNLRFYFRLLAEARAGIARGALEPLRIRAVRASSPVE
jgi:queuine/archaeosine tRNA-ribosyltransferase